MAWWNLKSPGLNSFFSFSFKENINIKYGGNWLIKIKKLKRKLTRWRAPRAISSSSSSPSHLSESMASFYYYYHYSLRLLSLKCYFSLSPSSTCSSRSQFRILSSGVKQAKAKSQEGGRAEKRISWWRPAASHWRRLMSSLTWLFSSVLILW